MIVIPPRVSWLGRGLVALAVACLAGAGTPGWGQDARQRASERLRALHAEAEQLLAAEKTLLVELRRLEVERDIRLEERRDAEAGLQAVTAELASTSAHLASLDESRAAQAPALAARLAEVYKLGRGGYLRMLLGVDDVRDMSRAYRTVEALAALDRRRAEAHASTIASLRQAERELEARRTQAARLQAEARAAAGRAAGAIAARAALVARIDAQRDLNAQLAGELEAARAKLDLAVADPAGAPTALPFRPFRGALDWPVAGAVVTRFGAARSPAAAAARNGIEIAAAPSAAVHAVHEGTVAFAETFAGLGPLVIVDHGSRAYTLYGYLATIGVTKGTRVDGGAPLGTAGRAPATGEPALYFEVRVDGRATDPLQWLKPRLQRP